MKGNLSRWIITKSGFRFNNNLNSYINTTKKTTLCPGPSPPSTPNKNNSLSRSISALYTFPDAVDAAARFPECSSFWHYTHSVVTARNRITAKNTGRAGYDFRYHLQTFFDKYPSRDSGAQRHLKSAIARERTFINNNLSRDANCVLEFVLYCIGSFGLWGIIST
jgi:hypothetical protein